MYKEWGPICWIFLHTIIEKLKDEFFSLKKELLIEFIGNVCNNLPCPICKKHAGNYLKTYKINKCNSRNDFRLYMFTFHNMVNKRLNKQLYKLEDLEKYKRCKFPDLLVRFNLVFKKQYPFTKTMDGWKRKKIAENIMEKIKINQKYFNQ